MLANAHKRYSQTGNVKWNKNEWSKLVQEKLEINGGTEVSVRAGPVRPTDRPTAVAPGRDNTADPKLLPR